MRQSRPFSGTGSFRRLAAQAQLADDVLVARVVLLLQIVEQATALSDHDQQTATGMEILLVALQVFRQILDPLGEDRDLNFRGAGVVGALGVFLDDFRFPLCGNRHRVSPFEKSKGSSRAPERARLLRNGSKQRACLPTWRKPCRPGEIPGYGRGLDGGEAQPVVRTEGVSPRWPSRPVPGCRPARSRSAKRAYKRRDYVPKPSEGPA